MWVKLYGSWFLKRSFWNCSKNTQQGHRLVSPSHTLGCSVNCCWLTPRLPDWSLSFPLVPSCIHSAEQPERYWKRRFILPFPTLGSSLHTWTCSASPCLASLALPNWVSGSPHMLCFLTHGTQATWVLLCCAHAKQVSFSVCLHMQCPLLECSWDLLLTTFRSLLLVAAIPDHMT